MYSRLRFASSHDGYWTLNKFAFRTRVVADLETKIAADVEHTVVCVIINGIDRVNDIDVRSYT